MTTIKTDTDTDTDSTIPMLPLFYKKIVPLDKEVHSELYLDEVEGYYHSQDTNSIYIAAIEFPHIAKEYPIVFAKSADDKIFPVALLGLQNEKNLYIDDKGHWQANYIPAYVRRYPFILATTGNEDNFTVCIDDSYPGFNTVKEGSPLFDEAGKENKILTQALDLLRDYQVQVRLTTLFCENLSKLDILEPMHANIEHPTGEKSSLSGFLGVNKEKFKALKPTTLVELLKSDHMDLIFAHFISLSNFNTLMQRMNP